jgi:transposase-like protein DUF772
MTYAALFLMMTWADAELAFRGRGPPPVPSSMSLVLVVWLWGLYGCENAATKVAVPVRKARRLQDGMCRPEAESYGRLIVMNVGVVGGAHCTTMRRHGDGQTQTRSAADDVGHDNRVADGRQPPVLSALEPAAARAMGRPGLPPGVYFRLLLIGYFEGIDAERGIAWRAADSLALRDFLGPLQPYKHRRLLSRLSRPSDLIPFIMGDLRA